MLFLFVTLLWCIPRGQSTHPLLQVAEITESDLELYSKSGQIMVFSKKNKASFYPFNDPVKQLVEAPNDLTSWTKIDTTCPDEKNNIQTEYSHENNQYIVEARIVKDGIHVLLRFKETLLAEHLIMQQVKPCTLHILEADSLPGPEIIVTWFFSSELQGFTIYRIPDTAH